MADVIAKDMKRRRKNIGLQKRKDEAWCWERSFSARTGFYENAKRLPRFYLFKLE
jgi:hypothetical protein